MTVLQLAEADQDGPEDRRGLDLDHPGNELRAQTLHTGLVLITNINPPVIISLKTKP